MKNRGCSNWRGCGINKDIFKKMDIPQHVRMPGKSSGREGMIDDVGEKDLKG